MFLAALLVVAVCLGVAGRLLIPTGLGGVQQIVPYLYFSHTRGEFRSPDGDVELTVFTNDAGAAHSGTFPTWVIRHHWYGDEAVTKGYLLDSWGQAPLTWVSDRAFRIEFVAGRKSSQPAAAVVIVK